MKTNKIKLSDFEFFLVSYGCYLVTYTSQKTCKQYKKRITDMQIIDFTKNAENAKIKDLNRLKKLVKN